MMDYREVIRRPIVTEKSMRLMQMGKYTFEVDPRANKGMIKEAVKRLFGVDVVKVNTITIPGVTKRRGQHYYRLPGMKKAIVTLKPGQKIEIEGLST
ncbi:MAG: 50S ribosomal protein L23 [Armatimonadota bacterium]|nr:50S ribosomal protein L23 [Armatimonadota bacterium]MDR5702355.1 50S ribosomal protein L23 [Armatimonadota bacterium]MDR7435448.1 50S ribosomal protein L23 [Armatimonadota bacterium]